MTFPLAEAETQLTMLKLLAYHTLALRDAGKPHTAEAAMCKWYGPKIGVEIIHQCLLTHGHYGYTMNMPHQQRLRDVMGLEIGDGTAQIQKLVIAREKVGRMAVQYSKEAREYVRGSDREEDGLTAMSEPVNALQRVERRHHRIGAAR